MTDVKFVATRSWGSELYTYIYIYISTYVFIHTYAYIYIYCIYIYTVYLIVDLACVFLVLFFFIQ